MKGFRPVRCSHPVHLDDDETEFGHGLHWVTGREAFRDEGVVRAGVDVFEYRVFPAGIEV